MGEHRNDERVRDKKNFVVMPYVNGISQRLKKVVARIDLQLVCSAPRKLVGLCKRVAQLGRISSMCDIKHGKKYSACNTCGLWHPVMLWQILMLDNLVVVSMFR